MMLHMSLESEAWTCCCTCWFTCRSEIVVHDVVNAAAHVIVHVAVHTAANTLHVVGNLLVPIDVRRPGCARSSCTGAGCSRGQVCDCECLHVWRKSTAEACLGKGPSVHRIFLEACGLAAADRAHQHLPKIHDTRRAAQR